MMWRLAADELCGINSLTGRCRQLAPVFHIHWQISISEHPHFNIPYPFAYCFELLDLERANIASVVSDSTTFPEF